MSPREGEAQQGEGKVLLLLSRTQRNVFTSGGAKKMEGWWRLHSHLTPSSCWGSRGGHYRIIHPGASGSEPGLGVQPPRITEWRESLSLHSSPPAGGRMLADLHINQSWVEKRNWEKKQKAVTGLNLTFHLDRDRLRLHHHLADAQSAAVLSSIRPLHVFDPAEHKDARHCLRSLWRRKSWQHAAALPDSWKETCDAISDGLQVVDRIQFVFFQILAILGPDDGVVELGVRDVHGAVECHLVALRQLDGTHGGFKVKPPELVRGEIDPRHCGRYHVGLCAAVDVAPGMLGYLHRG